MPSKKSASSRSAPCARRTSRPGSGGTKISGSTRVTRTCAACETVAGSTPRSIRNTSESKRAPSCRARTRSTTPNRRTIVPSGSGVSVTTTSSSCRKLPGSTPTQNSSASASWVPSTRPTALTRPPPRAAATRWRGARSAGRPSGGAAGPRGRRSGCRFCGARGSCAGSDAKAGSRHALQVGPLAGRGQAGGRRGLQPDHAGQRILDRAAVRDARVPGVAGVHASSIRKSGVRSPTRQPRAAAPRHRRAGTTRRRRFTNPTTADRAAARERQRPVRKTSPPRRGQLGRERAFRPAHRVLQPLQRRQRRVLGAPDAARTRAAPTTWPPRSPAARARRRRTSGA